MIIKPQKSTFFAWFFVLTWIPALIYLHYVDFISNNATVFLIASVVIVLSLYFTTAFSTYYLDYEGITQKCFFVTRHFYWKDFKFVGKQLEAGSGMNVRSVQIRCSTVPLPKEMTAKELEEKVYWPPSKTITIEWRQKGGDEFYQEFLSYCGGERDIRE